MNKNTLTNTAISLAPYVVALAVFVSWIWFKAGSIMFFLGFALALAWGTFAEARRDKGMDEFGLAAARFGAQWGVFAGGFFPGLLLCLLPVQALLVDFADWWVATPESVAVPMPVGMFILGMVVIVFFQLLVRSVMVTAWKFWKQ